MWAFPADMRFATDGIYLSRVNLVNHPYHGSDPAKYGVKAEEDSL